jgi:signal transduction histidine kinase
MNKNKKEKILNLLNYLKTKKLLVIVLFFSTLVSLFFMFNYFNLLKLQEKVLINEIDYNFKSILNRKYNEINTTIYQINKVISQSFQENNYNLYMISELTKIYSVDSVFIIPKYSSLSLIKNEVIEKEKLTKEYEILNLAIKAYEKGYYELSLSYLFSILNSSNDLIYSKIKSYYYIVEIFYNLGLNDNVIKFSNLALKFIFIKGIFFEDLIKIYEYLFNIYYDFNFKKYFAINIFFAIKYFNLNNYNINKDVENFFLRYCRKENEFIFSENFRTKLNNLFKINNYFLNYIGMIKNNNIIVVKRLKYYLEDEYLFLFLNFKNLYDNSLISDHYYFNIEAGEDYFLNNIENYGEIEKITLPFYSDSYPVNLVLFAEKNKIFNSIIKKQYFLSLILIIFLFLSGIFSILILFISFIREYELNQMKSDFISIVSHELKTPITTIQLVTDSILGNYDKFNDEKKKYYILKIKNESQRLLYLINNLLTFTKNEKNKKYIVLKEIDFIPVIEEVIELFKVSKKNINFILEFSVKNMIILGDSDALKQVIYNIIDNSYKYSGEEKIIKIITYEKGGQYFCEFIDNGFGIDGDDLKKIFDKFYRGKDTYSIPGTGLGLSLIKYIIEYHGAKVTLDSKKGVGTKITLIFNKIQKNIEGEKNGD